MNVVAQKLNAFFKSRTFIYVTLGFFILEALWFVFSAVYPMAFDEDFHFGLIKLYSHYWLPFLHSQPPDANQFGAVARDPSYLYHYLMSFPYRLVNLFTHNETTQVILLRIMNVAMFTGALVLYRRVMLRAKASPALANVTLAVFVLIPIVPQLAAHVNYDNFFMLLVALVLLNSFTLIEGFQKQHIDIRSLIMLVILCMIATLVKYAGLPILLADVLFLAAYAAKSYRRHSKSLLPDLKKEMATVNKRSLAILVGALFVVCILFAQRYGVNIVKYRNPVPDCDDVLTVQQCSSYGPWVRDYDLEQSKVRDFRPSILGFMATWIWGMWHRLYFAVNGSRSYYTNYGQLPVPSQTAIALLIVGLITVAAWWRTIFKSNPFLVLSMAITAFYVLVLWLNGYSDYTRVGEPVAINGRYLLPVLPLLAVAMGRGIALLLSKYSVGKYKPLLAAAVILLSLHGGGVFTFILRSDSSWYWPNPTVNKVNNAARKVLSPITIEGKRQ